MSQWHTPRILHRSSYKCHVQQAATNVKYNVRIAKGLEGTSIPTYRGRKKQYGGSRKIVTDFCFALMTSSIEWRIPNTQGTWLALGTWCLACSEWHSFDMPKSTSITSCEPQALRLSIHITSLYVQIVQPIWGTCLWSPWPTQSRQLFYNLEHTTRNLVHFNTICVKSIDSHILIWTKSIEICWFGHIYRFGFLNLGPIF